MKKRIKNFFVAFTFLFNFFSLSAKGVETFDHLAFYKQKNPSTKGPSKEEMQIAGKIQATAFYHYNSNNQLIKAEYLRNGREDGYIIYKYNENGLREELLYNASGNLAEKLIYNYNSNNELISYNMFDEKNNLQLTWEFTYNNKKLASGKRIANEEVTEFFTIEYENDGNKRQKIFSDNKKVAEIFFVYENKKLKQRRQNYPSEARQIDYFYNSRGQLVQMNFSSSEKDEIDFKQVKVHALSY